MNDEEFVSILVPKDRVMDIYAYLSQGVVDSPGTTASSGEPVTDIDDVDRVYEESPPAMKRFLDLLASHPDEWMSIDEIRDALDMKTHQLPGVLGAFQRRWQGRYQRKGRGPFEAVDAAGGQRYRMPKRSADRMPRRDWTLEEFRAATLDEGGPDAVAVIDDGLAWLERCGGAVVFGHGPVGGPLYLTVPNSEGEPVKVLAIEANGGVCVNYNHLKHHPPYGDVEERIRVNRQLNEIDGISIHDDYAARGSWPKTRLEALRAQATRAAFFGVFDDVARRLSGSSS